MSDDVRAWKDKASELTAKGKLPAAIETWQKVLKATPDDLGAVQKVAQLTAKVGKTAEALAMYEDLASRYAKGGLFFKASAVCRVILELDPRHQRTQEMIASLFARAKAPRGPTLPLAAVKPPPPPPQDAPPPAPAGMELDLEVEIEIEPETVTAGGLPSIPLFSTLTADELKEVLNTAMQVRSFAPGEAIVTEGAPGDSMFALVEGEAGVYRSWGTATQRRVAGAKAGDILGEVAMVSGAPRVATVVAEGDAVVLELTRDAMTQVANKHPRIKESLTQFYRERLLSNALRASPILRGLPEADQRALSSSFKPSTFLSDVVIITEGEATDAVYMVLRGACAVSHRSGERYPDLREGDLFGEVSLLTVGLATATVTALGPVLALKVSGEEFKRLVMHDPKAALAIKRVAQQRLARTANLDEQTVDDADIIEDQRV